MRSVYHKQLIKLNHSGGYRVMPSDTLLRFIGLCIVMFIFGLFYALIISIKPFIPRLTWLSVLFGDFTTDLGTGAQLLLFTGDPVLACLPILNHILTGGPMILGQILKHRFQNEGSVIVEGEHAN